MRRSTAEIRPPSWSETARSPLCISCIISSRSVWRLVSISSGLTVEQAARPTRLITVIICFVNIASSSPEWFATPAETASAVYEGRQCMKSANNPRWGTRARAAR